MDNLSDVGGEEFYITFIMDNAPVHRNCNLSYNNHEVKRFPPYSPMLNAIEQAFSNLKAFVKHRLNERMDEVLDLGAAAGENVPMTTHRNRILRGIVEEAIETDAVTQPMCLSWHNRLLGYVPQCLKREDISM